MLRILSFRPGYKAGLYTIAQRTVRDPKGRRKVEIVGFAAETTRIVPEVLGYHGPIEIALGLTPYGRIKGLEILHHSETREHMDRILQSGYLEAFTGKAPGEWLDVDMVSGATVTCMAITRAVQAAQDRLLGITPAEARFPGGEDPNQLARAAVLAGLFLAAFSLLKAHKAWRYLVLVLSAGFLGYAWNWSFTYTDLLDTTVFFTVLTVLFVTLALVATLLKGRIYCGWICPFGAVQELAALAASPLVKKRSSSPRSGSNGAGFSRLRRFKYVLLFLLLTAAAVPVMKGFFNPEPFSDFFSLDGSSWRFYLGLTAVVLSIVLTRPFCRYLCPTGALLACLNRLKGRIEERPEFDRCEGCGKCAAVCPTAAVAVDPDSKRILGRSRFECISCEECIKTAGTGPCNPNGARLLR